MHSPVTDLSADSIAPERLFRSFLMGGFECSTHKLHSGKRLDLIAATRHDEFARQDYQRLASVGIRVAREGVRWHLVEPTPGHYEFSSVLPLAQAANATGTQVIWDLCHFGWPDHIDIFKPEFVSRLQEYAAAFARWHLDEIGPAGFFVPINEISFFSWAGGDAGCFNPFATGRGFEMKAQLVRASLAAIDAIWSVLPAARFVSIDPIIHVIAHPEHPEERQDAEAYRLSQFQAWDMLAGKCWPELGGDDKYLDIIGVNFYFHNEWFYNLRGMQRVRKFKAINPRSPFYRPLRFLLQEVYDRYHRPIFIAETGAEDKRRGPWFRYIVGEVKAALQAGIPIHGICLYPILNHPGWVNERHCCNGLWDYADDRGRRTIYPPLLKEVRRAREIFEQPAAARRISRPAKLQAVAA